MQNKTIYDARQNTEQFDEKKYLEDIERAETIRKQRQIREIQDNIRRIDETLQAVERSATPLPQAHIIRAEREKLVAKVVELTGPNTMAEQQTTVVEPESVAPISPQPTKETPSFTKTYAYDKLFHENIDGDLILTFPDEVLKHANLQAGDTINMEVINGALHITKST